MDVLEVLERYPAPGAPFELAAFCGTWRVIRTSLPFWRKRYGPTITYAPLPGDPLGDGARRLDDDVRYFTAAGAERHVRGIDVQDPSRPRLFRWRGKPWYLRWTTSDWCVLDHDPRCADWAVTYFAPTLFTPAGIDLYARAAEPEPPVIAAIEDKLRGHPALAAFVPQLFAPAAGGGAG
ncbi:MAG TPA: hypothetical protein VGE07_21950 [Herpetosiphonaceae bacterium]